MAKKIQLKKNNEDVYPVTIPDCVAGLSQVAKTGSYNDLSDTPPPSTPEVFIAEYGVTTLAEVISAYNAGKFVALDNSGDVYVLCEVTSEDVTFCRAYGPNVYCICLDQDGYSDYNRYPIPMALSQLSQNASYRTVTDNEKQTWDLKAGLFVATVGTTSFSTVESAYNAGKIVIAKDTTQLPDSFVYYLTYLSDDLACFSFLDTGHEMIVTYELDNNNTWTVYTKRIPDTLSSLSDDSLHRTVTDAEKSTWNGYGTSISGINDKIPAQASDQNQLADKNFVNSSIQTSTATFQGNYNTWSNVPTMGRDYPSVPDSNDYMVVRDASGYAPLWREDRSYSENDIVLYNIAGAAYWLYKALSDIDYSGEPLPEPDSDTTHWAVVLSNPEYEGTWRFKYVPTQSFSRDNWKPEYQVNEKPLTAAQIAALNSNITAAKVTKLDNLPTKPVDTAVQSLSAAEQLQARTNIGATAPEIFWATYGTTTYAEVTAAITAGKLVCMYYNNNPYTLVYQNASGYRFGFLDSTRKFSFYDLKSNDTWIYYGNTVLETNALKVISWSATPSDSNYPSEKLVYDSCFKKGVISQTQTWTQAADGGYDYAMSNLVWGAIPQANIDLYEAAGATFNAVTGYFELNGLADISYEEITKMYNLYSVSVVLGGMGGELLREEKSIRTFFSLRNGSAKAFAYAFYGQRNLEVVEVGTGLYVSSSNNMFENNRYLKVFGSANPWTAQFSSVPTNMFRYCYSLVTTKISNLNKNISFEHSARLSASSVAYMINNAGSATITITLHATAYARATADTDVQTALANHTNVTLASN